MNYLKSFLIGSSWPALIPFFFVVSRIDPSVMNYTYKTYTMIAPIYLGLMNAVSLWLSRQYGWNECQRFTYISLISAGIVIYLARVLGTYNFTPSQWVSYVLRIIRNHTLTFVVTIRLLERWTK